MQTTYYKDKELYKKKALTLKPDNTIQDLEQKLASKDLSIFGYGSGKIKKYNTPDALRYKAIQYFNECIQNKQPILLGMLYIHLGVTRDYFSSIRNQAKDNNNNTSKQFLAVLDQIDTIIEGNLEKSLVTQKQINGLSLVLANRYGRNTSKQQTNTSATLTLDLAGLHQKANARRTENQHLTVDKGAISNDQ